MEILIHFSEIYQAPPPLLNVAVYCKSSNAEAYVKKLSQILANNIGNMGRVWSQNLCEASSKKVSEKKRGFGKTW